MRGWRLGQCAVAVAATAACFVLSGAAGAFSGTVLRGFGTPTVDGLLGAGEWDSAGHVDFTVNRSTSEGGGTVPATLYVMNDAANLYLGIKVQNATVGLSTAEVLFDNNHDDSTLQEGEDDIYVSGDGTFHDYFVHQIAPNTWQAVRDIDYGGTDDGDEADGDSTGFSFYEFSHPLDDADNAHDFSLRYVTRIGFLLRFRHCSPCASTSYFPASNRHAEIVIVSGSRVPPDTQISAGPAEGSMVGDSSPAFEFSGSDDVLQSSELTFECKIDEDWHACRSPSQIGVDDGRHTFSVRAVDDMLNADQSPAQRNWITDTTGPSKPVIRGRRSVRKGPVVLRFSATDEFTPTSRIRFKCAVDSTRFRRCPAVYRVRLRPGRHVVRMLVVDRLGNEGDVATFRIRVKRARR